MLWVRQFTAWALGYFTQLLAGQPIPALDAQMQRLNNILTGNKKLPDILRLSIGNALNSQALQPFLKSLESGKH